MGFIENIAKSFGYVKYGGASPVINQDGRGASYSQFGSNIYASEIVAQAVQCIANEIKKLQPKHIQRTEDSTTIIRGDIGRILERPNEIMTISDFLEVSTYMLLRNMNVFIYPTYIQNGDKRIYTGLYPLKPTSVTFIQDETQRLFVQFYFNSGIETILPYEDLIHWRYRFSTDDFMGGNGYGSPDDTALLESLQFDKTIRETMIKSANAPINGVVKYGSVISEQKLAEAVERFNKTLRSSSSGILPLDAKSEFQQMQNNLKAVDTETMEFIKQEIVDHFGVSLPVLHSVATMDEKQAFYDKTIEPLVLSLNQAFTHCLLTSRKRDLCQEIVFYEKDLLFMTMDQKIKFVETVSPLGALTNNQILSIFGFPPYPGGDIRVQSLNNVDTAIANDYQLNKNSDDEDNTDEQEPTNESEGENEEENGM